MKRAEDLAELMDEPAADLRLLNNTYQQFATVNRWLSGWRRIYRQILRPHFANSRHPLRILDIGAGSADVLHGLLQQAHREGHALAATAIDNDPRAFAYFQAAYPESNITYHHTTLQALVTQGQDFDIVICNHVLHHLDPKAIQSLCHETEQLNPRLVIFNDIHRGRIAYGLFRTFIPLVFRNSFVWEDGSRSIRRAYTARELREILPSSWKVVRFHPFRLLVIYEAA